MIAQEYSIYWLPFGLGLGKCISSSEVPDGNSGVLYTGSLLTWVREYISSSEVPDGSSRVLYIFLH